MTEKKFDLVPLGPFKCSVCGRKPFGYCGNCKALVCEWCWEKHKKITHPKHVVDQMHPDKCAAVGCDNLPTGGQQCAYCPAVLCDNFGCREKHEKDIHPSRVDKKRP